LNRKCTLTERFAHLRRAQEPKMAERALKIVRFGAASLPAKNRRRV